MKHTFHYDIKDIDKIGEEIIKLIPTPKVVKFIGSMGAGKTTLIKSVCKALGVEEEINSPTFAIVNEYKGKNYDVYHFDLYRLKSLQEAIDLGFDDYVYSDNYVFIEWPDLVENLLPEGVAVLNIKESDDGLRTVEIEL